MAVMLVNQSKSGNSGQKAKAGDNYKKDIWIRTGQRFTHVLFFKGFMFQAAIGETSVCFAGVSTSVRFIF